ncbi:MAG: DNA mismatch repair protein MutS, partial [Aggregatilineales bacterium]
MARITPARRQYLDIKKEYPDCIVLFRMGDFYEMFDEDAETAARELDITLTNRRHSKKDKPIPMAGVPYHAIDNYIARLIEKGYHVAVCDQTSQPDGRGIVDREVTRVVTPGTVMEPELLSASEPNYLMGIYPAGSAERGIWQKAGIAYVDISTGEFATTEFGGENAGTLVLEEIARLMPREVIMPESWIERGVTMPEGIHLTSVQDWTFDYPGARDLLHTHFNVATLDGYGLRDAKCAVSAAGAVLQYLRHTQKNSLSQLTTIRAYSTQSFMVLDGFTRRNLELTRTIRTGSMQGSLLGVLDSTTTAMGARLLRSWMTQPLLELRRLNARLDAVEALTGDEALRQELKSILADISDVERLVNRILIGKALPRDLLGLRDSLSAIPHLHDLIQKLPALSALYDMLDPCTEVVTLISKAIQDDAPAVMNTVGTIRGGFSDTLDKILSDSKHAREWIANLEPQERRRTGIASIKVGYNKVHG